MGAHYRHTTPAMAARIRLHAIEGSSPQRPPPTLALQGIAPKREDWRVVIHAGLPGMIARAPCAEQLDPRGIEASCGHHAP
jgi:hypothetical protein